MIAEEGPYLPTGPNCLPLGRCHLCLLNLNVTPGTQTFHHSFNIIIASNMFISLDHPVLLKVIKALQRRYWYTHHLWGQCLHRIQDQLHQRRQAGNIDIHIDEIISVLNSTIQTVRNETLTEADIIQIAENMFDDNDRIWPDGFYIDRLVRQFGIDSEAIPAPEGEQYTPP